MNIQEAKKLVRDFNITIPKKNMHKSTLWLVKDLYTELMPINSFIFNAELEYNWIQYKQSVYSYTTKKELDKKLKLCILYLYNQLDLIERGE